MDLVNLLLAKQKRELRDAREQEGDGESFEPGDLSYATSMVLLWSC